MDSAAHQKNLEKEEERRNALEARRMAMRTLLTVEAQERLNRITLVKPGKAEQIENFILKTGYASAGYKKIDEDELKHMIKEFNKEQESGANIKIQRKRWEDSD